MNDIEKFKSALKPFADAYDRLRVYGEDPTKEVPLFAIDECCSQFELLQNEENNSELTVAHLQVASEILKEESIEHLDSDLKEFIRICKSLESSLLTRKLSNEIDFKEFYGEEINKKFAGMIPIVREFTNQLRLIHSYTQENENEKEK